jgi:hypothetical protein
MSYELTDGSMSTDYKIGDEFTHIFYKGVFKFTEDDCTEFPWFMKVGKEEVHATHWKNLAPIKENKNKNSTLINQLHETIRQLKATIKELER